MRGGRQRERVNANPQPFQCGERRPSRSLVHTAAAVASVCRFAQSMSANKPAAAVAAAVAVAATAALNVAIQRRQSALKGVGRCPAAAAENSGDESAAPRRQQQLSVRARLLLPLAAERRRRLLSTPANRSAPTRVARRVLVIEACRVGVVVVVAVDDGRSVDWPAKGRERRWRRQAARSPSVGDDASGLVPTGSTLVTFAVAIVAAILQRRRPLLARGGLFRRDRLRISRRRWFQFAALAFARLYALRGGRCAKWKTRAVANAKRKHADARALVRRILRYAKASICFVINFDARARMPPIRSRRFCNLRRRRWRAAV